METVESKAQEKRIIVAIGKTHMLKVGNDKLPAARVYCREDETKDTICLGWIYMKPADLSIHFAELYTTPRPRLIANEGEDTLHNRYYKHLFPRTKFEISLDEMVNMLMDVLGLESYNYTKTAVVSDVVSLMSHLLPEWQLSGTIVQIDDSVGHCIDQFANHIVLFYIHQWRVSYSYMCLSNNTSGTVNSILLKFISKFADRFISITTKIREDNEALDELIKHINLAEDDTEFSEDNDVIYTILPEPDDMYFVH